jgi:hypothetical protein
VLEGPNGELTGLGGRDQARQQRRGDRERRDGQSRDPAPTPRSLGPGDRGERQPAAHGELDRDDHRHRDRELAADRHPRGRAAAAAERARQLDRRSEQRREDEEQAA